MERTATRDQHPSWIQEPEHGVVPIRKYAEQRKKYHKKWGRIWVLITLLTLTVGGREVEAHALTRGVSDAAAIIFYLSGLLLLGTLLEHPLKQWLERKQN